MAGSDRWPREYALCCQSSSILKSYQDSLARYISIITSTDDSSQGGVFNLQLTIPNDYPFKPPVLNFKTKIYHPNVADDGSGGMCLGLLRPDQWKPNSKLSTVLVFVQQILQDPILDDPVSANIANELKTDKKAFTKTAKEWTRKYAKG